MRANTQLLMGKSAQSARRSSAIQLAQDLANPSIRLYFMPKSMVISDVCPIYVK
jgi:hypothetical protein